MYTVPRLPPFYARTESRGDVRSLSFSFYQQPAAISLPLFVLAGGVVYDMYSSFPIIPAPIITLSALLGAAALLVLSAVGRREWSIDMQSGSVTKWRGWGPIGWSRPQGTLVHAAVIEVRIGKYTPYYGDWCGRGVVLMFDSGRMVLVAADTETQRLAEWIEKWDGSKWKWNKSGSASLELCKWIPDGSARLKLWTIY